MAAEITSFTDKDKIVQWLFEHACTFKLYDIIHEILEKYPKVAQLSHIRLALAAIFKIVTDEDVENFDLAVTLIEKINNYVSKNKVYKQLTETFKKKPQECSSVQVVHGLMANQDMGSRHSLLQLVKLLCTNASYEEMSDSLQSRASCSYSVLTGKPAGPVLTSTVDGNQIYIISSSSDSGPLTSDDTNQFSQSGLTNADLQSCSQECPIDTDPFENTLHREDGSPAFSSDEEKVQRMADSSIEDIYIASTDDETSSLESFPNIKVSKKFKELCVVKLHKDKDMSGSITDPKTNRLVDIYT